MTAPRYPADVRILEGLQIGAIQGTVPLSAGPLPYTAEPGFDIVTDGGIVPEPLAAGMTEELGEGIDAGVA